MKTEAAMVAKQIKKELKKIGVKSSVKSDTFSGGDSVNITVCDLSPELLKKVETICKKYQYGHFDGMTDSYEYSNMNDDLVGQVKFVFVDNRISDEMEEKISNWLTENDKSKQFDTDEKIKYWFSDCSMNRNSLIRRLFRGYDLFGGFWK